MNAHIDTEALLFGPSRERWLRRAAQAMQAWLAQTTGNLQPDVYVSVGFAGMGGKCQLDRMLGGCWLAEYKHGGKPHIFISPIVSGEPAAQHGVLHVLLHELCHAAANDSSHGAAFKAVAKAVGLIGPWRVTYMGEALHARVKTLAMLLGHWPHEAIKLRPPALRPKAEVLAGDKLGHEARIVIPSETKAGNPLPEHFVADILLEIAELFGGYTEWCANGGYIMANGKLKTEAVHVVDIAAAHNKTTKEHLEALAADIKAQGEQETVYLRLPGGRVELI